MGEETTSRVLLQQPGTEVDVEARAQAQARAADETEGMGWSRG